MSALFSELTSKLFIDTENSIRAIKNDICLMEKLKMSKVLEGLQEDESRLKKSIDDIENFHREMFALKKMDTPTDTEKSNSMTDNGNETYSASTESGGSGNEPMNEAECSGYQPMNEAECSGYQPMNEAECSGYKPMNEAKFPMNPQCFYVSEPSASMSKLNSIGERLILRIPKSRLNGFYTAKMEPDNNYASGFSFGRNESAAGGVESSDKDEVTDMDESSDDTDEGCYNTDKSSDGTDKSSDGTDKSSDSKDESSDSKDESSDSKDESSDSKDESSDGKNESSDGKNESSDGKNESSDGKNESRDGKNESNCVEDEIVKKLLERIDANKEDDIARLVLHLIKTFSHFQDKLLNAESIVLANTSEAFSENHLNIKIMLKDLSKCVLYLDKIVSDILAEYSKMLNSLSATFQ